jgi:hypothetical protein
VPAARLSDVLVRDPHPLVRHGIRGHLLDQEPVLGLDARALVHLGPDGSKPRRERVAGPLELIHAQDARAPARGGNAKVDPHPRERRAEVPAELALENGDLATQVRPGGPLVVLVEGCAEPVRGCRR